MSTDTDIWERALERAGVWKRGECAIYGDSCIGGDIHARAHSLVTPPPLGDPAAAMKMLEWLITNFRYHSVWLLKYDDCYAVSLTNEGHKEGLTLELALAAAILAIPEEHQP